MATKTVTTEYFTYDELSDKAKENVCQWWCSGSGLASDMESESIAEDLASARFFFENIGAKMVRWSLGAFKPSFIALEVEGSELLELTAPYEFGSLREYVEAGETVPHAPRGTSDGAWLAEGLMTLWNERLAPELDKTVDDLNALIAEQNVNDEARSLFDDTARALYYAVNEALQELEDAAVKDIVDAAEGIYEKEYMEHALEINEFWFDVDGSPEP